ncbi:MAG: hypothetical protein Q4F25_05645, partial [Eubacteriales bacterium]|nr:hypothetical protein [Eubacteriales bacterium]
LQTNPKKTEQQNDPSPKTSPFGEQVIFLFRKADIPGPLRSLHMNRSRLERLLSKGSTPLLRQ